MLYLAANENTVGMPLACQKLDFQMFAGRMNQPLLRLIGLWQEFQQASIAVKRLGDILELPQEPHALTPSREGRGPGALTLHGLAFRYGEHLPWLYKHLDLAFKPGRLTRVRQLRSQVLVFARAHFQKCHYNSANCSGAAGFSIPNA